MRAKATVQHRHSNKIAVASDGIWGMGAAMTLVSLLPVRSAPLDVARGRAGSQA
jgi:hypothetical protein